MSIRYAAEDSNAILGNCTGSEIPNNGIARHYRVRLTPLLDVHTLRNPGSLRRQNSIEIVLKIETSPSKLIQSIIEWNASAEKIFVIPRRSLALENTMNRKLSA